MCLCCQLTITTTPSQKNGQELHFQNFSSHIVPGQNIPMRHPHVRLGNFKKRGDAIILGRQEGRDMGIWQTKFTAASQNVTINHLLSLPRQRLLEHRMLTGSLQYSKQLLHELLGRFPMRFLCFQGNILGSCTLHLEVEILGTASFAVIELLMVV